MSGGVGTLELVDAVLALTLLEAVGLVLLHRFAGRGPAPADILPTLAGGLFLMASLRAAISGASWAWVLAPLAAAGLAHALDLRRRWPRPGPSA